MIECTGLLSGITVWHIRKLTDSQLNGGAGYDYEVVGKMSLDQVYHRLCDLDLLKPIGKRTKEYSGISAIGVIKPDKDGMVAGRDLDGNPIKLKIGGKSRAQMLMEEAEARSREKSEPRTKKKRRRN